MSQNVKNGILFDTVLLEKIRKKFLHVKADPKSKKERLFFDNSGGSLRLKTANEIFQEIDAYPDCPEHGNKRAKWLMNVQLKGYDALKTMMNFDEGSIVTSYSASMVMFAMVRAVIENISGKNVVTTSLEHPSVFDAVCTYAQKYDKEVRVAKANHSSGGVDVGELSKLIDKDTCLLVFTYASNISGALLDAKAIVKACRAIKPDLYIIVDAVQHAPHGIIDLKKVPVDGLNIAPYKFFAPRGIGIGYVSPRLSKLPHDVLLARPKEYWQLGSPAPAHFAAVGKVVEYVCWIGKHSLNSNDKRKLYIEGMKRIKLHERALMHMMLEGNSKVEGLRKIKGLKVYFDEKDLSNKDFIMAIAFDKIAHKKAVKIYEKNGVISFERVASSPYSARMLNALGIEGCIRVSPLHCHRPKDIEEFLKITKKMTLKI